MIVILTITLETDNFYSKFFSSVAIKINIRKKKFKGFKYKLLKDVSIIFLLKPEIILNKEKKS
jgi:hypothetical protein